eukprot:CAMPEP_0181305072 /NCGR_PEP_ID=MMETSP1101-20121128/9521_1 /TAXON_ID=46948 /ORGANISM="Rhodomonas abbreviata, Strain Caron Lab Isolate" /LENGTH=189 /DNA_ID=CAMNT_0023410937 /DNA_START=69 /DNA_END=638 /DNA_ORIENTATION=-
MLTYLLLPTPARMLTVDITLSCHHLLSRTPDPASVAHSRSHARRLQLVVRVASPAPRHQLRFLPPGGPGGVSTDRHRSSNVPVHGVQLRTDQSPHIDRLAGDLLDKTVVWFFLRRRTVSGQTPKTKGVILQDRQHFVESLLPSKPLARVTRVLSGKQNVRRCKVAAQLPQKMLGQTLIAGVDCNVALPG